jgi:type III restriction enzyme
LLIDGAVTIVEETSLAMPTLNWIGKEAVVDHHRRVPTRLLKCDDKLSVGDPDVEEQNYALFPPFTSTHQFKHHAFEMMFEMNGEEFACQTHIDSHPSVARWIRNTERTTQGGFWLPKSPGKFFPNFIVEMKDGAIVLVEYKMGKMASDAEEQHKKAVGQFWAARSNGRFRFAWIVDKDWSELSTVFNG